MMALPLNIGPMHFVGIGGIGMSGIAEILHNLGYKVQGSDIAENANVKRLRKMGISVSIGHTGDNIGEAQVLVTSSAVKSDNPEVAAARKSLIPIVRRAEMLGELMRLKWSIAVGGTHGKTTTTSLISAVLDTAAVDPTVINGGIINAFGSNAKLGEGDWLVAEADESDGTFVKLPATIAIVTNIDPEHLDHYGTFDALRAAFRVFVENIPFYGFAALCIDDTEVQALIPKVTDRRVVTYGFSPQADVRAINLETVPGGSRFDVVLTDRKLGTSHTIVGLSLPMSGEHNICNTLAAIVIANEMKIEEPVLRRALADFEGVKRRFTRTGEVDGIGVVDDYGHHPVEIGAVLRAARMEANGKVVAVVQPHRYSRLQNLFEGFCTCFNDADVVIVADIYPAGETPIEGVDQKALVDGLRAHGHRMVVPLDGADELPELINDLARPGDLVVCLGAGNITAWANDLPAQLTRLRYGDADGGD
ncbi:MAG: UDP-N-acetylmuramate--L-alanine ligase [Rhodospirillales bacterium]|jgi:UDP-N-acetylmuramate--alanine ligase|nr:UDP-N-acetylmuramate--L-alanine ligase [Rhodospirillales bacterium]